MYFSYVFIVFIFILLLLMLSSGSFNEHGGFRDEEKSSCKWSKGVWIMIYVKANMSHTCGGSCMERRLTKGSYNFLNPMAQYKTKGVFSFLLFTSQLYFNNFFKILNYRTKIKFILITLMLFNFFCKNL